MSLIELPKYKLFIVCVYKSPDGQFDKFLDRLELIIQKLLKNDKILLLCGDWNIDFLQDSGNLHDLKDLFLRYNLVNTVQSPTRVTKSISMLTDVMIINKIFYTEPCIVIELGLLDHYTQMLPVVFKITLT
jgi:exonuclease III